MTTKRTKSKNAICPSSVNGGMLTCALDLEHQGVHSSSATRRPSQHATWSIAADGRILVVTYVNGRRRIQWTEDPPASVSPVQSAEEKLTAPHSGGVLVEDLLAEREAKAASAIERVFESIVAFPGRTALEIGRKNAKAIRDLENAGRIVWRDEGWHPVATAQSEPEPEEDDSRPQWLRDQTAERDAAGRVAHPEALVPREQLVIAETVATDDEEDDRAARYHCEVSFVGEDGREHKCEARNEHNGPHYAWSKAAGKTVRDPTWSAGDGEDDDEDQGDLADDSDSRPQWLRDLSRQTREENELHAAALESTANSGEGPSWEAVTCSGVMYRLHPAARIFTTPPDQYERLRESIRVHGQRLDVEVIDDTNIVIDGCSRIRACAELKIAPKIKRVRVDDPIAYVIAANERRHLNESQRAMAAARLARLPRGANQHTRGSADLPMLTQAEAAELLHVSPRLVGEASRLLNLAPSEVVAAIDVGRMRVGSGTEIVKLDPSEQREMVEEIAKGDGEVRAGKVRSLVRQRQKREVVQRINESRVPTIGEMRADYGVALSDPAWPYDNSDQHEGSRGHIGYPGHPVESIVRLHTQELPSRMSEDAILFLCVTNAFVPIATRIAEAGAWTWRTMITITKSRTGLGTWPRGRTEHVVVLSRGEPVHTLNEITTWLGDRAIDMPREHSRKPEELYLAIEKHCAGPRIELYSRVARDGWDAWGAEAESNVAANVATPKRKSKILTATDARLRA